MVRVTSPPNWGRWWCVTDTPSDMPLGDGASCDLHLVRRHESSAYHRAYKPHATHNHATSSLSPTLHSRLVYQLQTVI